MLARYAATTSAYRLMAITHQTSASGAGEQRRATLSTLPLCLLAGVTPG